MLWVLGFLLLFIALLIPILAIVLDSPVARNLLRGSDLTRSDEVMKRIRTLEEEVQALGTALENLKDETEFIQRLLENPEHPDSPKRISPPES